MSHVYPSVHIILLLQSCILTKKQHTLGSDAKFEISGVLCDGIDGYLVGLLRGGSCALAH